MARQLRIEYPNAVYHVTSRGNARADVYLDNSDREAFLDVLEMVVSRYNWLCHAYCLMGNHYHLENSGDTLLSESPPAKPEALKKP